MLIHMSCALTHQCVLLSSHHGVGPCRKELSWTHGSSCSPHHILVKVKIIDIGLLPYRFGEQLTVTSLLEIPFGDIFLICLVRNTQLELISMVHVWHTDSVNTLLLLEIALLMEGW